MCERHTCTWTRCRSEACVGLVAFVSRPETRPAAVRVARTDDITESRTAGRSTIARATRSIASHSTYEGGRPDSSNTTSPGSGRSRSRGSSIPQPRGIRALQTRKTGTSMPRVTRRSPMNTTPATCIQEHTPARRQNKTRPDVMISRASVGMCPRCARAKDGPGSL